VRPRLIGNTTVVEDVLTFLDSKTQENGATVTWDLLPMVKADAVQRQKVFQNIISNAIKFRKPEFRPKYTSLPESRIVWSSPSRGRVQRSISPSLQ
jgi:light-regulated signal transduction histidine kinase (bacteriophytochrome)